MARWFYVFGSKVQRNEMEFDPEKIHAARPQTQGHGGDVVIEEKAGR